ncbi:NADP-dependent oxidoreductase [Miniimonas sp. S16]|uniref:NADP-dependent oxidoreductase n=1 Tax=Miniimonas sp. S16 TaxID=2171623 RepID=UPI000D526272|nr:NADP-dependent oxidoreductase [Miniimonas sp. S16]
MKAIAYSEFGSADVLHLTDLPDPHIGSDAVVVKVEAAGVNPVDYKVREGHLAGLLDTVFPVVPGWDVAGTVVAVGLDTPELQVGDAVMAYARKDVVSGGTLAELVQVPVRTAARKPDALSFVEAAALPLAGLTALQSIRRAGVAAGQHVLVHGAAGGVGSLAVQLLVHQGAHVVGTASEGNHDYLRALGATPVAYGEGLADRALAVVPEGFDVVLDYVGGAAIDATPALLAEGGTVVSVADPRARTELGGHYVWVRPDAADLAELGALAADGVLRLEIAETFPLERAADAHRLVETGHVRGKVVVTV